MVSASLLAGSTLYVGYKVYSTSTGGVRPAWWQQLMTRLHSLRTQIVEESKARYATSPIIDILLTNTSSAQRHLAVATTALGAATVGTLYYPPLRLACIPAFLYLGVAPTQRIYRTWRQSGRVSLVVVEGALLALCLVQGQFLVGSVCFSLYYLGQVIAETKQKEETALANWSAPQWAWLQRPEGEVATPIHNLQIGDTIVIYAGEMIPVTGVVASGVAWIRLPNWMPAASAELGLAGIKVSAGQPVTCATVVLIGAIHVTIIDAP